MHPPPAVPPRMTATDEPIGPAGSPGEVLAGSPARGSARHVRQLPARDGVPVAWPDWVSPELRDCLARVGITSPWAHQARAAQLAHAGQSVVVATGTASGKTLAMGLAVLDRLMTDDTATALYLSPTKALAHDQLRALTSLEVPGLRSAAYDGDTPVEERQWVRAHAQYVLTNPDLVHRSLLPRHTSWARFLRGLSFVVVDEAHHYRGMFGSHVAMVLRRLLRVADRYGAQPVVLCASATMSDPARTASTLVGHPVIAVTEDCSPHAALTAVLWEPPDAPEIADHGEKSARRSTIAESADLLAGLVDSGVRSLAFVASRRGAETIALLARERVAEPVQGKVAAYRGGYLPEERRALEADLREGRLLGLASTSALELGIDISGLDAVITTGWPGTRSSLWQQWGRAGRRDAPALGILVAREDPLDRYVLEHPGIIFDEPTEAVVLDPHNPHVLGPHLLAACAEFPIDAADDAEDATRWFGWPCDNAAQVAQRGGSATPVALLDQLVVDGVLRRRRTGWFWVGRESPAKGIDIRGAAGTPVRLVEPGTGRLLGTVEARRAPATVHAGAVYLHQGVTHVVSSLDLEEAVAFATPERVDYSTTATEVADYRILETRHEIAWGQARLSHGDVEVTSRVVGFVRRRYPTGEVIGEEVLDLPESTLRTRATWWTLSDLQVGELLADGVDVAGAAHAAEHAAIGLLPLIATCDRWDIGGVSTLMHPDTGRCTVLVYDGHPGGAGFAQRAYEEARRWLRATRDAIDACPCSSGCPACVQSPKCGNGNEPLDKRGAVLMLDLLLAHCPDGDDSATGTCP